MYTNMTKVSYKSNLVFSYYIEYEWNVKDDPKIDRLYFVITYKYVILFSNFGNKDSQRNSKTERNHI